MLMTRDRHWALVSFQWHRSLSILPHRNYASLYALDASELDELIDWEQTVLIRCRRSTLWAAVKGAWYHAVAFTRCLHAVSVLLPPTSPK